ncbi:MAG: TerB family tellurite resistance protein [Synechococcaceae cyanobacterium SM2_3_2]|nr:TerB family tellurite resistance protein [Synechococcaceae cyanobacterium SM2_3_2]
MVTPPAPPAINPSQMNLLRAVTAMAWADGVLEPGEIETMTTQLAHHFEPDPDRRAQLASQLKEYFQQRIPLEEVLPKLKGDPERKLVLKLGYLVIAASARTPEEPVVNVPELEAFRSLVTMLDLPPEIVHEVSQEAASQLNNPDVAPIDALVNGFTNHYSA